MSGQRIFQVIYIRTTPAALWDALTNPEITQRYWFDTRLESSWEVGAPLRYVRGGQLTDEHVLLEVDPPRRLCHTFQPLFGEFKSEPPSRVTFLLDAGGEVMRLTVIHEDFPPDSRVFRACRDGWPMILSSLKSLLETGAPLPAYAFEPQAGTSSS